MKLMSFYHDGAHGFGVVDGSDVIDVSVAAGTGWARLSQALANSDMDGLAAAARRSRRRLPLASVSYLPPVTDPEKILCVGLNYRTHGDEADAPTLEYPSIFVRFPSSQVGHGQGVVAPAHSEQFDFEGEMAVVIGRPARHVPESRAFEVIAGYTIFGEHSVRDWQFHSRQATPGKNFWHSGAIGPWLVTTDEIGDPGDLRLRTLLNGQEMQNDTTANLIFKIPYLVSYISGFARLMPGDIISTGTPSGVGLFRDPKVFMKPGDTVEVEIEGIGTLANPVVAEPPPAVCT